MAETTTGADGTFSLPGEPRPPAARLEARPDAIQYGVIARADDGRLGWAQVDARRPRDGSRLRLLLAEPAGTIRGRLVDQDSKPIAGGDPGAVPLPTPGRPGISPTRCSPLRAASFLPLAGHGAGRLVRPREVPKTAHSSTCGSRRRTWGRSMSAGRPTQKGTPAAIALDRRVATIAGRLKLPAGAGSPGRRS
ncbi:MAG: hypothetical protein U0790_10755 [Isosphaeraceae bacterium]